MTSWQFGVATPVHYLRSGQFTADLGWQHHVMTHGADLELIIGLQGSVALAVGAAGYQVEPGDVLTVFPHETIRGTRPTLVPSAFIWFHVVPTSVERPVRLPRFFHLADQAQAVIAAKQLLDIAHGEHRLAALAIIRPRWRCCSLPTTRPTRRREWASNNRRSIRSRSGFGCTWRSR
ncbi:AraC family ligand binding domain-containing protein [Lacticaseibacillus nasuensis]|uniref:AraC family ligand binding domain-containing protein n=1 Tax=Lacticaseibacillus nasuensis TaxID=944671 RepID=UPI0006D15350|nr:AraC family ligand binding domain-containing protein [Lacticaseibacillus nasuensis]